MAKHRQSAFTLVELSIVLVILGLLVGGVLAGQSLIHAAELRAVSNEFRNYQTAFGAFREKYFALPGDMPNAVHFWGAQDGGTADGIDSTCAALTASATGTATCNGNGDGAISIAVSMGNRHEIFRAWQHLANAGLVEGNYGGVRGRAVGEANDPVLGLTVPKSKSGTNGWTPRAFGPITGNGATYYDGTYKTILNFGAPGTDVTDNPGIKAEDAYNLDMKMDDGKPGTGVIVGFKSDYLPACVDGSNIDYLVSDQTLGCALIFKTGF